MASWNTGPGPYSLRRNTWSRRNTGPGPYHSKNEYFVGSKSPMGPRVPGPIGPRVQESHGSMSPRSHGPARGIHGTQL